MYLGPSCFWGDFDEVFYITLLHCLLFWGDFDEVFYITLLHCLKYVVNYCSVNNKIYSFVEEQFDKIKMMINVE